MVAFMCVIHPFLLCLSGYRNWAIVYCLLKSAK